MIAVGLTAAIIGTDMIVSAHLCAARNSGATVVGVLASSPERSVQEAERWSVPRGYPDLAALIADRPDVVHICSPNTTHVPYGDALIAAGINVVIEKPIATSVEHAERLAAAAEKAGVVATAPYVYWYHPLVREIRARRTAGELGDVVLVHGSYLNEWVLSPEVSYLARRPGGRGPSRMFADIGSHWCDLAEFVSDDTLPR